MMNDAVGSPRTGRFLHSYRSTTQTNTYQVLGSTFGRVFGELKGTPSAEVCGGWKWWIRNIVLLVVGWICMPKMIDSRNSRCTHTSHLFYSQSPFFRIFFPNKIVRNDNIYLLSLESCHSSSTNSWNPLPSLVDLKLILITHSSKKVLLMEEKISLIHNCEFLVLLFVLLSSD